MSEQPESQISSVKQGQKAENGTNSNLEREINPIARWLEVLAHLGLGESLLRFGTHALSVIMILLVVWLINGFYNGTPANAKTGNAEAVNLPTPTPPLEMASLSQPETNIFPGIGRLAEIHTIIPDRPREELTSYIVEAGDTIWGIAEKFGLQPQTVLWGNYYTLRDDPHNLRPGQKLNILPLNGTYYEWQNGDGLNAVAKFFEVTPEEIINYPPNQLNAATIGEYANPNIKPGTWLIVPGGTRPFISWSAPVGVTRDNPAVARVMGPGSCGTITDGVVGSGGFIWPADHHFLSGFDYSPETNHRGIDIDGETGDPVYAVDHGVIVYAGWNDYGYGNMIMIDHGTGWQSLYAHLSVISVVCGESVIQGNVIGLIGSTGNSSGSHLHFELMNTTYGKVNPWDFLPPP
jgi:hypothetical protein